MRRLYYMTACAKYTLYVGTVLLPSKYWTKYILKKKKKTSEKAHTVFQYFVPSLGISN